MLGLRAIFSLAPEARGRLNGVYLATFRRRRARLGRRRLGLRAGRLAARSRIGLALPLIALARFVVGAMFRRS